MTTVVVVREASFREFVPLINSSKEENMNGTYSLSKEHQWNGRSFAIMKMVWPTLGSEAMGWWNNGM